VSIREVRNSIFEELFDSTPAPSYNDSTVYEHYSLDRTNVKSHQEGSLSDVSEAVFVENVATSSPSVLESLEDWQNHTTESSQSTDADAREPVNGVIEYTLNNCPDSLSLNIVPNIIITEDTFGVENEIQTENHERVGAVLMIHRRQGQGNKTKEEKTLIKKKTQTQKQKEHMKKLQEELPKLLERNSMLKRKLSDLESLVAEAKESYLQMIKTGKKEKFEKILKLMTKMDKIKSADSAYMSF